MSELADLISAWQSAMRLKPVRELKTVSDDIRLVIGGGVAQ